VNADLEHLTVAELLDKSAGIARRISALQDEADALPPGDPLHADLTRTLVDLARTHALVARELTKRVVRATECHPRGTHPT
jgi:hypothetical protein